MDADVTAILAAIDAVSKKVDSAVGSAKDELKEDIQNVQKTVDKHTSSLQHVVRVVAGNIADSKKQRRKVNCLCALFFCLSIIHLRSG